VADQPEVLEHDADAPAVLGKRFARRVAQFLPEQAEASARRPLREVEELEQRRLPGAGRAGEKIEATILEAEIEVAQDLRAGPVPQPNAIEFGDLCQLLIPSLLAGNPRCLAKLRSFLFTLRSPS
jgi:hypothetical protein